MTLRTNFRYVTGNAEIARLDIAGLDNGGLDIDGLDSDGLMCVGNRTEIVK